MTYQDDLQRELKQGLQTEYSAAHHMPFSHVEEHRKVESNVEVHEGAWVSVDRDFKIQYPGIYDGTWIVTKICGDFARIEQPESARVMALRSGRLHVVDKPSTEERFG